MRLIDKGLILILVPLLFELLFVGTIVYMLRQADEQAASEARAGAKLFHVNNLMRLALEQSISTMSKSDPARATPSNQTAEELATIESLMTDDKDETEAFRKCAQSIAKAQQLIGNSRHGKEPFQLLTAMLSIRSLMSEVVQTTRQVVEIENKAIVAGRVKQAKMRENLNSLIVVGILFHIGLALTLALYFYRSTAIRLRVVIENAKRMATGQELLEPLRGADEVAAVDNVFHEMAKEVRKAHKTEKEFVAMITHDLRSPITAIGATLNMFASGTYKLETESGKKRLMRAQISVRRLMGLLNNLLDLDRLELEMSARPTEVVNLASVATEIVESAMPTAESSQVSIKIESEPSVVLGDRQRLGQLLANLVSNAIQHSPDSSTIVVSIKPTGETVEVAVQDEGSGVPPELQQVIFDRYKQVQRSDQRQGTGLGLAICKAIVESHGGTIGVTNCSPHGSRFWFRLNLAGETDTPADGTANR